MQLNLTISGKTIGRTVAIIVTIAAVTALALLVTRVLTDTLPDGALAGKYQAVTLTSGQKLFGDVQQPDDGFVEIRHAHRIAQEQADEKSQPTAQVVPIETEAIEPRTSVFVDEDEILFVQPLKRDSVIIEIIDGAKDPQASKPS